MSDIGFERMNRAAIVIAEAASCNAEIAGMQAENQWRAHRGEAPAYVAADFEGVRLSHANLNSGNAARFIYQD